MVSWIGGCLLCDGLLIDLCLLRDAGGHTQSAVGAVLGPGRDAPGPACGVASVHGQGGGPEGGHQADPSGLVRELNAGGITGRRF